MAVFPYVITMQGDIFEAAKSNQDAFRIQVQIEIGNIMGLASMVATIATYLPHSNPPHGLIGVNHLLVFEFFNIGDSRELFY